MNPNLVREAMDTPRWIAVSEERQDDVVAEIARGSEPRGSFCAMLNVSAMIACLGLVANSTAVIIGAMLVSPLMTPIFGIALGMLKGDHRLFWRTGVWGPAIAVVHVRHCPRLPCATTGRYSKTLRAAAGAASGARDDRPTTWKHSGTQK